MTHIMCDLETFGKRPGAVIVAIGAVKFDPIARTVGDMFYQTIDVADAQRRGLTIDASTVQWWMSDAVTQAARDALFADTVDTVTALEAFSMWATQSPVTDGGLYLWGNGAAFDNVILQRAYEVVGLDCPFPHWGDRCYRTIKSIKSSATIDRTGGVYHNALDDAEAQARHLIEIVKETGIDIS